MSQAYVPESDCNTRKEKDKRLRRFRSIGKSVFKIIFYHKRHTVGLHIAAWPCGVIPDFAELFGSESISKV